MHTRVTGHFLFFFFLIVLDSEQIRRSCIGYACSIGPACSYDRSRIKQSDIFSRNIRSREIEAESDKTAGIFLLLFSLFWKLRAYVERIRHFINGVIVYFLSPSLSLSASPLRFSFPLLNRVKLFFWVMQSQI